MFAHRDYLAHIDYYHRDSSAREVKKALNNIVLIKGFQIEASTDKNWDISSLRTRRESKIRRPESFALRAF